MNMKDTSISSPPETITGSRIMAGLRNISLFRILTLLTLSLAGLPAFCASAQQDDSVQPAREQFIPADQLDVLFARERRGVLISRAEFQQLLKKAGGNVASTATQPVPMIAEQAMISVRPAELHLLITMEISVRQFAEGWQTLRLPLGNLLVESAEMEGLPAAMIARDPADPQTLVLVNEHAGQFILRMQLSAPMASIGSDRAAAFQLPQIPSTQLEVRCPAGQHLLINDLQTERPAPSDLEAVYRVALGASDQVRLRWTADRQQTESQTLVFVSTDAQLQIQKEAIRWQSTSTIGVFGGTINQIAARIPSRMEVTGVESTGLEAWKLDDDSDHPGDTRLTLTWRQPFTKDRLVRIHGIVAQSGEQAQRIPTLEFLDVTAHSGRLAITHEEGLRLMAMTGGGVRASVAAETKMNSAVSVFDFWQQQFELSVAVKPRDRELFGELTASLNIQDTSAVFTTTATIETLNAPLFETALALPTDWQLISVTSEGNPVSWQTAADDGQIMIKPPAPVAVGGLLELTILMTRSIPDPETEVRLPLPVITPVDTTLAGGSYSVQFGSDLEVSPLSLQGLQPIRGTDNQLIFRNLGTELSGELAVRRRPSRFASRSVLRTSADTRQQTLQAEITVDVLNGTTRSLVLRLPERLGSDVHFTVSAFGPVPGLEGKQVVGPVRIVEQTPQEPSDGLRPFLLRLDRRFSGSLTLQTIIQRPRTAGELIGAPNVHVQDAVRQQGVLIFEASAEQQLKADQDVSRIDGLFVADAGLADPPPKETGRRVALTYRFVQPGYQFAVEETRFDTQAVPTAVAEKVHHVCTFNNNGTVQRLCKAEFRTSGVQTLQFQLPDAESSFLWSTILNGEPVEVRRDGDHYLVALPADGDRAVSHENPLRTLEILFESTLPTAGAFGYTEQMPLQFRIDLGDGQESPIDVLLQTWAIHYPQTSLLVNSDGHFRPVDGTDQPGLFRSAFQLKWPDYEKLSKQLIPIAMFVLVLFVITALGVKRRWKILKAAGFVVGMTILVVLLYGIMAPRPNAKFEAVGVYLGDFVGEGHNFPGTQPGMGNPFNGRMAGGAGGFAGGGGMVSGMPDGAMGAAGIDGQPARVNEPMVEQKMMEQSATAATAAPFQTPALDPFEAANDQAPPSAPSVPPRPESSEPEPSNVTQTMDSSLPAIQAGQSLLLRKGSARLSVPVVLEIPGDYRMREFLSTGDSVQAPGALQIVIQSNEQITSVRAVTTLLVLLIFWWLRSCPTVCKILTATSFLIVAAGAIPLVPNQWQSVPDGLIIGTVPGAILWFATAALQSVSSVFLRLQHRTGASAAPHSTGVSSVAILLTVFSSSVAGLCQEEHSKPPAEHVLQPDVVVPYKTDEPPLQADRVFLSHEQFLQLYRQANPGALAAASGSPHGSSVLAAFYQADQLTAVADNRYVLSVTARYVIFSNSSEAIDIPLPIGPVSVRSVMLDGQPATLRPIAPSAVQPATAAQPAAENQSAARQQASPKASADLSAIYPPLPVSGPAFAIVSDKKGAHIVDLEFDVNAELDAAAETSGSAGRVDIPFRPVAAGTLHLTLPEADPDVRVNGRSNLFRRDGKSVIIPISDAHQTRIQWQPSTKKNSNDVVYHSAGRTSLTLADAGLSLRSTLEINVRQGELSELEIGIPENYLVQSVSGEEVAGWSVLNTDDSRSLKLLFRQSLTTTTAITLLLYSDSPISPDKSSLNVPIPIVHGATRDLGTVTLLAGSQFQVRSEALSAVTQINPDDAALPEGYDGEARRMLAWRYTRHPAVISVRATRTAEEIKVLAFHAVRLESQRELWTSRLTLQISGAPRSRVDILLPRKFLLLDISATDLSDWYFDTTDGSGQTPESEVKTLSLQLRGAREGQIDIVLQGQMDRDADRSILKMQVPNVTDATVTSSHLAVWLDNASENAGIVLGDWTARPPAGIDASFRKLMQIPANAAFASSVVRPGPVSVTLRQSIPTLIAESVTVTDITEASLELTLALTWQITRAAADTFVVEMPAALATSLTWNVPDQRRLIREDLGNGRTRVIFQLQQPVSDRLFILGTGMLPLPTDEAIRAEAPVFTVTENSSANLAGQSHYWVLVNQSSGLLQPTGDQKKDEVGPGQISTTIPHTLLEQAVTIQRLKDGASPWNLTFPEQHRVSPAVVTLASHVTVLSDDGSWRSRHQLQVRNESRQFLPVVFPSGSRLLYCLVEESPVRVVTQTADGRSRHLIPIPQTGTIAGAFNVEFALAGMFPEPASEIRSRWQSDRLTIPVPRFPEFREDPEFGISVSRNRWSVYVPESWNARLVDDPRLTNVISADQSDLEDASLLSQVELTGSLLNSLSSAKDSVSRRSLLNNLRQQQDSLNRIAGNASTAEAERNTILNKLGGLQEIQQSLDLSQQAQQFSTGTALGLGLSNYNSNQYLFEKDASQNRFNDSNGDLFLNFNRPQAQSEAGADGAGKKEADKFNFELPEQRPELREQNAMQRKDADKPDERALSEKSQLGVMSGKGLQSQLLQRRSRDESRATEKENAAADMPTEMAPGDPQKPASELQRGDELSQAESLSTPEPSEFADTEGRAAGIGAVPKPTGMLSLRFEIPEDGTRLDFIRTGGNPVLTFDVRSEQVVSKGAGILWALGCIMTIALLAGSRRVSPSNLAARVCLLIAVASLSGSLILAEPVSNLCMMIFIPASVAFCVLYAVSLPGQRVRRA
jgi:hypothetical protein